MKGKDGPFWQSGRREVVQGNRGGEIQHGAMVKYSSQEGQF